MTNKQQLIYDFVKESNKIEGIIREPSPSELLAHTHFIELPQVFTRDLEEFVSVVQPGAKLRTKPNMNVTIGDHYPPQGGTNIKRQLDILLEAIYEERVTPFEAHVAYETLHPFMDGNGRSGRALWAWQMCYDGYDWMSIGFLHNFYYQALSASRKIT